MNYTAVLFDLDNTLFDRRSSIDRFITRLYKDTACCESPELFRKRFLELDREGYGPKPEIARGLISSFGPLFDEKWFLDYFSRNSWRAPRFNDNADHLLRMLRSQNIKTGVVTNGTVLVQEAKIEGLGLRELVDTIVISEQAGVKKPDSGIFLIAAAELGVEPGQCLFVGDRVDIDIQGSQAAGMRGILYDKETRLGYPVPDVIHNLNEIKSFI